MHATSTPYRILLACTALWCALVLSPVALSTLAPASGAAAFVDAFFSRICHQLDSHSLHLFGVRCAVCERCCAIYAGMFAGILLVPVLRTQGAGTQRWLWCAAAAPMVADVLLSATPWYAASLASRLATGGIFGVCAGILLVPSFVSAWTSLFPSPALSQRRPYEPTTR